MLKRIYVSKYVGQDKIEERPEFRKIILKYEIISTGKASWIGEIQTCKGVPVKSIRPADLYFLISCMSLQLRFLRRCPSSTTDERSDQDNDQEETVETNLCTRNHKLRDEHGP
jgi:hypothetical protein